MVINISTVNLNGGSGAGNSTPSGAAPVEISTLNSDALAAIFSEVEQNGFPKQRYTVSTQHPVFQDTGVWGLTEVELTTWMKSGNELNEGVRIAGFGTLSSPQGIICAGCYIYNDNRIEIVRP